ncbi:helix-turn-helix domain-containing protein [Amycolatopsis mongoliensis]|uniref:Helix-turn-helix domain-containing protein n=1 Tax=Amycolatopsis mongoliensis TaxID=715475 RepID=A0A9Y2NAH4_9PSEU|nr:TetR/AcrR family transcriptional regulator [Amycolatopsis sp. 4-36]WIX98605.1 helix-turn-helix domain-containing protein [Amycolatopsis sp. 4-36]
MPESNRELLLTAAREAFAAEGTLASLRDVARRAGVGIGTLYRHFPTREALLEAVLDRRFAELRERAEELLGAPPQEALLTWLTEVAAGARTYLGLPQSIMAALADEGSALHASCMTMRAAGETLLTRAQRAGAVRGDLTIFEVISLVLGVAWAAQQPGGTEDLLPRLLSTAMHGMTTPARSPG